ncbi:hypothetical protein NHQ30_006081 [Ciborinia camelliae]|nr:hypothetical protein NHQ30_006081 [Ciborinia camelliae]
MASEFQEVMTGGTEMKVQKLAKFLEKILARSIDNVLSLSMGGVSSPKSYEDARGTGLPLDRDASNREDSTGVSFTAPEKKEPSPAERDTPTDGKGKCPACGAPGFMHECSNCGFEEDQVYLRDTRYRPYDRHRRVRTSKPSRMVARNRRKTEVNTRKCSPAVHQMTKQLHLEYLGDLEEDSRIAEAFAEPYHPPAEISLDKKMSLGSLLTKHKSAGRKSPKLPILKRRNETWNIHAELEKSETRKVNSCGPNRNTATESGLRPPSLLETGKKLLLYHLETGNKLLLYHLCALIMIIVIFYGLGVSYGVYETTEGNFEGANDIDGDLDWFGMGFM